MRASVTPRRAARAVFALLLLSLLTGFGAGPPAAAAPEPAAEPPAARDPKVVHGEAFVAAEDLTLTHLVATLSLTPEQMRRLLPVLEGAQAKLRKEQEVLRQRLAGHQPALEKTRAALVGGREASTRAEGQVSEELALQSGKLEQTRADLITSLRRSLERILTTDQYARLGRTNRALGLQRRKERTFIQAAQGVEGGGDHARFRRVLDRMRRLSPSEYGKTRFELALHLAGLNEKDEELREQGQPGLSPDDPDLKRQLAPYYATMDRLRDMPEEEYQQKSSETALQIWVEHTDRAQNDPAATREASAEQNKDIEGLLDRYLLSPRMIVVLRERLAAPDGRTRAGGVE